MVVRLVVVMVEKWVCSSVEQKAVYSVVHSVACSVEPMADYLVAHSVGYLESVLAD